MITSPAWYNWSWTKILPCLLNIHFIVRLNRIQRTPDYSVPPHLSRNALTAATCSEAWRLLSINDDGEQTRARITPRSSAAWNRLGYQDSQLGSNASTSSFRLIPKRLSALRFSIHFRKVSRIHFSLSATGFPEMKINQAWLAASQTTDQDRKSVV